MTSNCCAVLLTLASSSAAVDGMVSTPPPAKRSLTSGMARIFTTSAWSLSTISFGVPLGASSSVQFEASTSLTPCDCRVGHSGLNFEGWAPVTASTRSRRRATLVGNVLELSIGVERQPLDDDLVDAAVAGRGNRQTSGLGLGRRQHVGDALVRG